MAPGGAWSPGPPQIDVAKIHRPGRTGEDHRTRLQVLLRRAREVGWVERPLGEGDIAGCVDESLKLGVGDLVSLDPEAVDADPMGGGFLGIVLVGPHSVGLSRNPRQTVARRRRSHARGVWLTHVASVNTVFQSFLMLTTVQFSRSAVSSACSAPAV